jgi:serine-type D-Ala-D-Ala carboxypeptidase (penicillin-binding protein 5/6)
MHHLLLRLIPALPLACVLVGCGAPEGGALSQSGGGYTDVQGLEMQATATLAPPTEMPRLEADAYCLVDADSGIVLASRRGWESRPVASTQKLLTALVAVEHGHLDRQVIIVPEDVKINGSTLGLRPGEAISRRDLIKALLMVSGNDAALALARDVGGSVKGFAQLMNQRAESAGATRSRFVNPHGLTQAGQHSNAKDMAIIAMAAYANGEIRRIVGTVQAIIYSSLTQRHVRNTNDLVGRMPGCTGMKTGFTPGAGICLVSALESRGRTLILVQLDSTREDVYNDAARAMLWGITAPAVH